MNPATAERRNEKPAASRPAMTFRVEDFDRTVQEAVPLLRRHADEVLEGRIPAPVRPKLSVWAKWCRSGAGLWIVARGRDGTMQGYALFTIGESLTYADTKVATAYLLYLTPEARRRGLSRSAKRLIDYCEEQLAARGVRVIEQHTWVGTGLWRLLDFSGYQRVQEVFWKQIGE